MYTIFFTINCVEQLTFSKTFVDHLQFLQLIFFWLKVKLIESSWFPKINWIQPVDKKSDVCSNGVDQLIKLCRPVFLSNQILSSWSCPRPFTSFPLYFICLFVFLWTGSFVFYSIFHGFYMFILLTVYFIFRVLFRPLVWFVCLFFRPFILPSVYSFIRLFFRPFISFVFLSVWLFFFLHYFSWYSVCVFICLSNLSF